MTNKTIASDSVLQQMEDLAAISKKMYDTPEVAYQEHATANLLCAYLGDHGFEIEKPVYGLETAFTAKAGSSGPEVVICAEMDALPGIGHACGHNVIAASALGAGVALAPLADELGIRLMVLGTPAEEHYGGKVDLINAGAFSDAAIAMMVHPSPHDVVDPLVIAVAHWDVEFHGKTAHASAYPHIGINALDDSCSRTTTFRCCARPSSRPTRSTGSSRMAVTRRTSFPITREAPGTSGHSKSRGSVSSPKRSGLVSRRPQWQRVVASRSSPKATPTPIWSTIPSCRICMQQTAPSWADP